MKKDCVERTRLFYQLLRGLFMRKMSKIAEGFLWHYWQSILHIVHIVYTVIVELFNKSHFDLKDPVVRIWIKSDISGWKQFYIIVCFRAFMPWRIGPCSKNLVRLGYIRMKTILCSNFPPFFLFPRKKAILNHVLNVWDKIFGRGFFSGNHKKTFWKTNGELSAENRRKHRLWLFHVSQFFKN